MAEASAPGGSTVKETGGKRVGAGLPGPGRPAGLPNKASAEMKAFVERFLTDEGYRANLKRRIMAGKAPHMEALLWQHLYGRPKGTLKVEDETPRRVATLVFLDGKGRDDDPLARPGGRPETPAITADKTVIAITPKTVRPSVALPEVSFEMDDIDLPPREGR